MNRGRRYRLVRSATLPAIFAAALLAAPPPSVAHDVEPAGAVVIDSDLGLDDVVALALALQSPQLEVAAVVASEGVAAPEAATRQLAGLLTHFNRGDIRLHAAMTGVSRPAPPFRPRAAAVIESALPEPMGMDSSPFDPRAYVVDGRHTTVLALGPLTQLAAAMEADPEIVGRIDRVVVASDPEHADSWNLSRDPGAVERVRGSGVEVVFVRPGHGADKPDDWFDDRLAGGQRCSLAETLLGRMFDVPRAQYHYLEVLASFHDELAVLFAVRPGLFTETSPRIFEPKDSRAVVAALTESLSRGRQRKRRVVLVDGPLPAEVLRPDVRARREVILANNGPDEWFAQLLLSELHDHLGAYSVIGVKMGLRAAELLNAPPHAMAVDSHAPLTPPISCLNDGLLVATGSTPGRGLFAHTPGPPGTVKASFSYNGRVLELRLRRTYQARIRTTILGLLDRFTLADDGYWDGVRSLGLEIWQDWHRRDLFVVVEARSRPGS